MNRTALFLSMSSMLLLSACGGSSSSNKTTTSDFDDIFTVKYTQGTYDASSKYKDYCENPRTGIDPTTKESFLDKSGSSMQEKMWLRSYTYETYLWYNEVPDIDPTTYSVLEYFDVLKTSETTASGKAKDQFHFYRDTEEYQKLAQSGVSLGYGIEWAAIETKPPRSFKVAYTEEGSPAALANIPRGAELIEVDGVDFINGSDADTINNALFPEEGSGSHTLKFRVKGSDDELTVSMNPTEIESDFVSNVDVINTDTGNVGYLKFDSFQRPAQRPLIEAFTQFKTEEITDLVLDLRYNGGGLLAMASQLSYMIAGDNVGESWFYRQLRNDKTPADDPWPYFPVEIDWEEGVFTDNQLPTLSLNRVFVLTTSGTCSASEAVMNGLLGSGIEVIQIGSTTCGKPYGFAPTDNCGITYNTVQFKGENSQGFGDYADGFSAINTLNTAADPNALIEGCDVADDFENVLGSTDEAQLAAALGYRLNNSCPNPATAFAKAQKPRLSHGPSVKDKRLSSILKNNLIIER